MSSRPVPAARPSLEPLLNLSSTGCPGSPHAPFQQRPWSHTARAISIPTPRWFSSRLHAPETALRVLLPWTPSMRKIGRASCRERVAISVVAGAIQRKVEDLERKRLEEHREQGRHPEPHVQMVRDAW